MTTIEALRRMRELLAKGWTQDCCCRDRRGMPIETGNAFAVSWCVIGAALTACPMNEQEALNVLRDNIGEEYDRKMRLWNDAPGRTQSEVLALMDRVIEAEEAKQGAK
jgi:hypothetical protein